MVDDDMERSWKSGGDGVEQCEVISVSDDSPSIHHDDVDDDEPTDTKEVHTGGSEVAKHQDGGREAVERTTQHGGAALTSADDRIFKVNGADQYHGDDREADEVERGASAVTGEVQNVTDDMTLDKDQRDEADCKPTATASQQLLQVGEDAQTGVSGVRRDGSMKPRMETNETTRRYRRATARGGGGGGRGRVAGCRRSPAGSAPDAGGAGAEAGRASGRRRGLTGVRGVAPLSLRQFYDSGRRDYVEYLLRHIHAAGSDPGTSSPCTIPLR